ncbi:isoprenylcysteine carboxylmethyltransferase family protein [Trichococcus sp.]|uniref:isoprenylcysteine carboxylmethyltransferase family protein n=1 Tax=Trichococcus sp. TaxID=1985464 RepID=UPI003C7DAD09
MNAEFSFRLIFWIHLILIMIFNRILPALRAKKSGAKLSPDYEAIENEGKFLFAFRVIAGLLLAVVIVIYTFFPIYNIWFQFYLPSGLRWVGVIVSSISLFFWSYSQEVLDKNWSVNLKIQEEHTLVTSGPYRVMRHPIYTAMIIWSTGLALYTANMFFVGFTALVILWTPLRISKEETMLIGYFGDEYKKYMEYTGRYLPKFKRDGRL